MAMYVSFIWAQSSGDISISYNTEAKDLSDIYAQRPKAHSARGQVVYI